MDKVLYSRLYKNFIIENALVDSCIYENMSDRYNVYGSVYGPFIIV